MKHLILRSLYGLRVLHHRIVKPLTLGVRCFVFREDGRVLLVRHTYLPGWYLPGGGVERGESLEAAVTRELREEVGVVPLERPQLFHAYSNFSEYKSDHVVVFSVSKYEMTQVRSPEIAECAFFPAESPPDGISAATRRRLAEWLGEAKPGAMW